MHVRVHVLFHFRSRYHLRQTVQLHCHELHCHCIVNAKSSVCRQKGVWRLAPHLFFGSSFLTVKNWFHL